MEWRTKNKKRPAAQVVLIWLVGWLVVDFKASHERICGMAGKEKEAAALAVLI